MLSAALLRAERNDSAVVLAFPSVPTYVALANRLASLLGQVGIGLWLVEETGEVRVVPVGPGENGGT